MLDTTVGELEPDGVALVNEVHEATAEMQPVTAECRTEDPL